MWIAVSLPAVPAAAAAEGLKVGLLLPLSGDLATFTPPMQNGVILGARFAWEAGGRGAGIGIISRDSHTDITAAVEGARKLVEEDGVGAIIGPMMSESVIELTKVVTVAARVTVMTPSATAPDLSGLADEGFVFRTIPSDEMQGEALAGAAMERGWRSVGVMRIANLYGKGLAAAFEGAFTKAGGRVVSEFSFSRGQSTYRPELVRILDGEPDALLIIAYPEDGVRLLKQAVSLERPLKLLFSHSMKDEKIIPPVGADLLNGALGTAPMPADISLAQKFRDAYREMFGAYPDTPYIDSSFDAIILLALAAARGGAVDGTALRDNLRAVAGPPGVKVDFITLERAFDLIAAGEEIDYQGVSGPLDFDANGDVTGGAYGIWTIENGEIREIRRPVSAP